LGLITGLGSVDNPLKLSGIKTRLFTYKTPNIVTASAELSRIPLLERIIRIPKGNFQNTHGVNSHAQPMIQKHVCPQARSHGSPEHAENSHANLVDRERLDTQDICRGRKVEYLLH
jgi:hypothetical protein